MPSKTAYRGKNKERPRAHGVHLVSESQNEGSIWACASSYPAHKREMPCIDSNTKRMMKAARKGSDSNTNCITPRHLRKYVHLRLQLTIVYDCENDRPHCRNTARMENAGSGSRFEAADGTGVGCFTSRGGAASSTLSTSSLREKPPCRTRSRR